MAKDSNGLTAFQFLCRLNNAPIELISKFIETGGKELVLSKDKDDNTGVLHHAIKSKHSPIATILKFIEVGGYDLVMEKNITHGATHCTLHVHVKLQLKQFSN